MGSYNLRADVLAVLDTTSLSDPGEVADKVLESIPPRSLRNAMRVTLRAYVREVIREARPGHPPNFQPAGGHPSRGTQTGPAAGRSWKGDGIRDALQSHLRSRFHVSESEWRQLREMTYADLMFAAAEREATATRNQAWARILRAYAALLTEYDVATFGDLPTEVQMQALGGTK